MNNRARDSELSALGAGTSSGTFARRIVPAPTLSAEGKPAWWADVLTGRIRRDWDTADENPREGLWARR